MYKTRWEKEEDSKNQHQNKTNLLQGEKKNRKNKIQIKLDEMNWLSTTLTQSQSSSQFVHCLIM